MDKEKIGYWSWWYQRNKEDLRVIGIIILFFCMIAFVLFLIYLTNEINNYVKHSLEQLPTNTSVNPLPFFILVFIICIFLLCFLSYRKHKKEVKKL